jgi:hypothetical protein
MLLFPVGMRNSEQGAQLTLTPLILVRIQVPQPRDFLDIFAVIGAHADLVSCASACNL